MLTFIDKEGFVKTPFTINASALPFTALTPSGEAEIRYSLNIGGIEMQEGDVFFLNAKDATDKAALITAVSNNTLASLANTTSNATCRLGDVGD